MAAERGELGGGSGGLVGERSSEKRESEVSKDSPKRSPASEEEAEVGCPLFQAGEGK